MSDYFPASVLTKILLQLPVKSLIRFTLVSKTWQAFITSPDFVDTYNSRVQYPTSKNLPKNLLIRYYSELDEKEHYELRPDNSYFLNISSEINSPVKSRKGYSQIVGSCNGILCLCDIEFSSEESPIILWNPSIQKHVELPLPRIEPRTTRVVLGFGLSLQGNDYKVVRILYHIDEFYRKPFEAEIFSLRSKGWKSGNPLALRGYINDIGRSQVYLNGIVYWMAYQREGNAIENSILGFDCSEDEFKETMLPYDLASHESNPILHLFAHEGCLGMISYNNPFCSVWEMRGYGSTEFWTKLYYFEWTQLYEVPLERGMSKVVGFRNTGELLVTMFADKNIPRKASTSLCRPALGELISYNPETRQISKHPGHLGWMDLFRVVDYVETLSLLDVSSVCLEEEDENACLEGADNAFKGEGADYAFRGEANERILQGDGSNEVHDFGEFIDNGYETNDCDVCSEGGVDVNNEAADDIPPIEEFDDSWVIVSPEDL